MGKVVRIDSNFDDVDGVLKSFCSNAELNPDPPARNMEFTDWESRPETLMNQIYIQKIYDAGGYFCLIVDDAIVAGSGAYPFHLDENIIVTPVRLYTPHNLSAIKSVRYIQRLMKYTTQFARDNYKAMVTFVNDYNEHRIKCIYPASIRRKNFDSPWESAVLKPHDSRVEYKYTIQQPVYSDFDNYENEIKRCLKIIEV